MPVESNTAASDSQSVAEVINPQGTSDIVLVCEHASAFIPPEFHDLDLSPEARLSHIAWDPGALAVAQAMSAGLDAPLVVQHISRLVYDCNRPPESSRAVPEVSEIFPVPGNTGLTPAQRRDRAARFYVPFRDTLGAFIEQRIAAGRPPVIVTIHSFTPVYQGERREVEIGILHDADALLADAMLARRAAHGGHVVRRNDPYGPADGVTHTIIVHGVSRGLLNVMIEVRNDLIADAASQQRCAGLLAAWVTAALADLRPGGVGLAGRQTEKARHA